MFSPITKVVVKAHDEEHLSYGYKLTLVHKDGTTVEMSKHPETSVKMSLAAALRVVQDVQTW